MGEDAIRWGENRERETVTVLGWETLILSWQGKSFFGSSLTQALLVSSNITHGIQESFQAPVYKPAKSLQSCLTLWNPMDYRLSGSSVHGILQARTLEWIVMPLTRGSSWPRDQTWISCVSCTAGNSLLLSHQESTSRFLSLVWSLSCVRLFVTPMDCSTPGFPVHHQLLELAQTHVHQVGDAIQPSHPLLSPSPPA